MAVADKSINYIASRMSAVVLAAAVLLLQGFFLVHMASSPLRILITNVY